MLVVLGLEAVWLRGVRLDESVWGVIRMMEIALLVELGLLEVRGLCSYLLWVEERTPATSCQARSLMTNQDMMLVLMSCV